MESALRSRSEGIGTAARRLARAMRVGFSGRISRPRAVELARDECVRRGLPWCEPTTVRGRPGEWVVVTLADRRAGHLRVSVDRGSGAVIRVIESDRRPTCSKIA